MKRSLQCALALLFLVATGVSPAFAQGASCDRACLKTLLDQYLNAVIKHDPAGLPLVVGFRQTENAINVRPPNGVWKTMTGLGKVQRRYLDPVSGQAGFFGIIEEGSEQAIATVRLRVENRKLTEAEWYLARPDGPRERERRQWNDRQTSWRARSRMSSDRGRVLSSGYIWCVAASMPALNVSSAAKFFSLKTRMCVQSVPGAPVVNAGV